MPTFQHKAKQTATFQQLHYTCIMRFPPPESVPADSSNSALGSDLKSF